ncbi:cross-pathway control protein A [Aspergillus terreus]|uniref:Cross-pathway control protein A n=1 Tax=Aspergillus terreus TaxID=33178 RepID=A0A5M3YWN2_ASPTE|nr:hypothetical protein ATETN484_0005035900 [Aspergillus terreus]GFF17024.1 cross-pathway control protein A [Aspergillus terreus]
MSACKDPGPDSPIAPSDQEPQAFSNGCLQPISTPNGGPLNFSIASRSSSSHPNSLPTFDVTSFTTDNHQQSWLPSPPPQQPLAQHLNPDSNAINNNNSLQEDFVLYPAHPRDSRAPAPLSTTPRLSPYYQHLHLVRSGHLSRRHSLSLQQQLQQQQLAASPVQVPRVTRLAAQSTGFPLSTSLRSSPSSRKQHLLRLHAAAVASNSAPSLPNSAYPSHQRPPVPLFNSPVNYTQKQHDPTRHRRIMSTPNIVQDLPDLFDFTSDQFGGDFDAAMEPTMLSPHQIPTGIMASKDPMGEVPSGTISPKDLLMDASAPPSTSFTDLSTPSFESPGYFSQDTSPMFATDMELGPGHEEWDSLFPPQDGLSIPFDSAALEVTEAAPAPTPAEPKVETPCASTMIRNSSRAPSPGSTRSGTKHSTVAGVNARQRKPLPPIKYDSADPVALKRARNTEAARKSRARKLERQEEMERRIAELEKSLEEAQQREQYWKALAENRA